MIFLVSTPFLRMYASAHIKYNYACTSTLIIFVVFRIKLIAADHVIGAIILLLNELWFLSIL